MSDDSPPSRPSFEESLQQLQGIAARLEDGSQGLENSLRDFEQAMGLLRTCYGQLASAEQQIELLTGFNDEGQPETAPFEATPTAASGRSRQRS